MTRLEDEDRVEIDLITGLCRDEDAGPPAGLCHVVGCLWGLVPSSSQAPEAGWLRKVPCLLHPNSPLAILPPSDKIQSHT